MATQKEAMLDIWVATREYVAGLAPQSKKIIKAQNAFVKLANKRVQTLNKQIQEYAERLKKNKVGNDA